MNTVRQDKQGKISLPFTFTPFSMQSFNFHCHMLIPPSFLLFSVQHHLDTHQIAAYFCQSPTLAVVVFFCLFVVADLASVFLFSLLFCFWTPPSPVWELSTLLCVVFPVFILCFSAIFAVSVTFCALSSAFFHSSSPLCFASFSLHFLSFVALFFCLQTFSTS